MGETSRRTVLSPDMRLSFTIHVLSEARYQDVMGMFKVGTKTMYEVFHSTCEVRMKYLSLPGLPTTLEDLRESSYDFKISRRIPSPIAGCIGALGGICIQIRKQNNALNPAAFYCRKGCITPHYTADHVSGR